MLAAVQATDERLIAFRYLMRISAHLAFSSSAQKDDSQWGPSLDCRVGVVSPFAHKKQIAACCSFQDDFSGNVAILNVNKRRHSDVVIIVLTADTQN